VAEHAAGARIPEDGEIVLLVVKEQQVAADAAGGKIIGRKAVTRPERPPGRADELRGR